MSVATKLSPELLAASRVLEELEIADRAWPPQQALRVLDELRGKGIAVLGGDIYEERDGRAAPTYDNWHCNRSASEPFEDYATRSLDCADDYLRRYPWPAGRSLLVGFVFAEPQEL